MPYYHIKRALDILWREGAITLFKRSIRFFFPRRIQFKLATAKNKYISQFKYRAPADPYKLIRINPNGINYRSNITKRTRGLGQVIGGDWDTERNLKSIDDNPTHKGIRERYEEGRPWEETAYWDYAQKRGDSAETRCEYVDELYTSIKQNGYLTKEERGSRPPSKHSFSDNFEIEVHIGRDGEIIINDGHHRCAIARVLNLHPPAHVICRHKQWQELRDDVYSNGLCENRRELRDHPDLQDILN